MHGLQSNLVGHYSSGTSKYLPIVAQRDPEAARRLGNGILDHVHILSTFPFIGPAYPRGSHGPLLEITFRPYRIFYDVSEDSRSVEILHVWHSARDEPTI